MQIYNHPIMWQQPNEYRKKHANIVKRFTVVFIQTRLLIGK